jgi:hypothetical protein
MPTPYTAYRSRKQDGLAILWLARRDRHGQGIDHQADDPPENTAISDCQSNRALIEHCYGSSA